jgi:disulfide oxidoreductase YuzD
MKLGNTQLEIKFNKSDIVEEYLDICKSCKDLRVIHNSVIENDEYQYQYIKIKEEINEFINVE